jgi:hypothetical protein
MLQQLDDEIREQIARETQDNIERGMPPEEARYAAVRKFGNVTRVKEETREVWSLVWLEQLGRLALRPAHAAQESRLHRGSRSRTCARRRREHLYRDQFGGVTAVGTGPTWFFTGATIVG